MQPLIIGIAGGTGSGKTALADQLLQQFGEDISLIRHQNYYIPHPELTLEERRQLNFDHPACFDTALLLTHLQTLRQGKPVDIPVYDYVTCDRMEDTLTIPPTKVILVEGILIFEQEALRDLMDIKIFVDTDADVRCLRRLVRDVQNRGRSMEEVIEQYLSSIKPMHEQFVEPSKRYADVILPEGGKNLVALAMLVQRIAYHIEHGNIVSEQ